MDMVAALAGESPKRTFAPEEFARVRAALAAFSARLAMQHVVNHSSYHRGQVVTLLRQLSHTPVATDFLAFVDAAAEGGAPDE